MTHPSGASPGRASGLYAAKAWYTRRLAGIVSAAVRAQVSPNVFTWLGVIAGLVAAGVLALSAAHPHPLWALAMTAALAARLAGANLDGAVARARGVSRPVGFVLNEIGDRAGDLAVMLVLAHLAGGWWGLIGLAGSTLPTFAALAVTGAGGPRINGGPVGKTERCALLVITCLLTPWWNVYAPVAALIGLGGLVTAVVRLRQGARALPAAERPAPGSVTDGHDSAPVGGQGAA